MQPYQLRVPWRQRVDYGLEYFSTFQCRVQLVSLRARVGCIKHGANLVGLRLSVGYVKHR